MREILVIVFLLILPINLYAGQEWRQRASEKSTEVAASDIEEEIRFGREVAARILARTDLYSDDALNRYLNLVGKALALNSARPELEFRFAVLDTMEINAYAAPGGYVFITKGAIASMRDEAELAGVLAHEISHIIGRHIIKEFGIKGTEDSPMAGLARLIGGGTESARVAFYQAVDKAMDILFKDGYKRSDEAEADRNAVMITALSGYEPSALSNYLERLKKIKGQNTEVLNRTHPPYDERTALIKRTIKEEGLEISGQNFQERFLKQTKGIKR
jgi:predicted Zn-dependent protease